jgi:hypothetical protein
VAWIVRVVKTGAEGDGPCTDVMEINRPDSLGEIADLGEAREDIRSLVGEVVLTPREKRGQINAILRGELMAILDLAAGRRRSPSRPRH